MVRETRHLWVGNLPDNIREDRIREHFKRYGRVQSVKLLGRGNGATEGTCATVAFMDIKSAAKAHNADKLLDERAYTTEYYEPAAIPTTASAGSSPAGSGYSASSGSVSSASRYQDSARHAAAAEDGGSVAAAVGSAALAGGAAAAAAGAAAGSVATWRGTNDSADRGADYHRRGNTPVYCAPSQHYRRAYPAHPPVISPGALERTPHHRWYACGAGTGESSAPSTPGATEGAGAGSVSGGGGTRRRRRSGSGAGSPQVSSRSSSSSGEPSSDSRASTPGVPGLGSHRNHTSSQWSSTSGRPLAICVRNLPARSSDSSLKDGLYHEYKKHGKVAWVKVVGMNAERFAVVRFKKPSDVEKALEVSQDKLFFGCKISVVPHQGTGAELEDGEPARPYETDLDENHPKATRTLFIGNLEKDVTVQQLRDKFKHFGRIIEIDVKKQSGGAGYAFCQYASISSVVEAIRKMDGEYVGSSRVKLGFGKSMATTCVWIDGLTEHTEKQVLGVVSRCGAATSVCVDRSAGAALVHFEQAAAAAAAVRELRRVAAACTPVAAIPSVATAVSAAASASPAVAAASATPAAPPAPAAPIAPEADHRRMVVDFASRECQDAFYEQLEKHGGSGAATLASTERLPGEHTPRYTRHDSLSRYEVGGSTGGCRSRAASYNRSSSRYALSDHYDVDYDRRYRVYDELGSSSPADLDGVGYEEARSLQSVVVASPRRRATRHHRRRSRDSTPDEQGKVRKERHHSGGGSGRTGDVRHRSRSGSRRRRTSDAERRRHRRRREESGAESRAGTPLRDELPEGPAPADPRRPPLPRDRSNLPMSLSLPKFAEPYLMRSTSSTATPSTPATAPASPPRAPSASSSSGGSAPHSPSLEERIRSLDEKYEKWSGSRAAAAEAAERGRFRHRLLDIDIKEVKPSEVVRSLLAKRSIFDEDSERLEGSAAFEKRSTSPSSGSPRSREPRTAPRALQYPFPTHPPPSTISQPTDSPSLDIEERVPPNGTPVRNLRDSRQTAIEAVKSEFKKSFVECSESADSRTVTDSSDSSSRPDGPRPNRTDRPPDKPYKLTEVDCKRDTPSEPGIRTRSSSTDKSHPDPVDKKRLEKTDRDRTDHDRDPRRRLDSSSSKEADEKKLDQEKEKVECTPLNKTDNVIKESEESSYEKMNSDIREQLKKDVMEEIEKGTQDLERQIEEELQQEMESKTNEPVRNLCKNSDHTLTNVLEMPQEKKKDDAFSEKHENDKLDRQKVNKDIHENLDKERQQKAHVQRINKENTEMEALERARAEKEVADKLEKDHLARERERVEKEQIEKEQLEKDRAETERVEREKAESREQAEKERIEKELQRQKAEKEAADREKERLEFERLKAEKEKLKQDAEAAKIEREKLDKEKQEKERLERERVKAEREHERLEKDKHERENDRHEEKGHRHESKKERSDKDRRKEDHTEVDILTKSRKDDKHKHERHRKEHNETKRESKKDKESESKSRDVSRKSSRDESSREMQRKDSSDSTTSRTSDSTTSRTSDSTTSRTSHEPAKYKDFESVEVKDSAKHTSRYKQLTHDYNHKPKSEKETSPRNTEVRKNDSEKNNAERSKEPKVHSDHSKDKLDNLTDKQRHYSLDSQNVENKRKERLNSSSSLPANIGIKRRMSSQDILDCMVEECKKAKIESKIPERRDSKELKPVDKPKPKFNKGHFAKLLESKIKDDKKNQVKPPDEPVNWHENIVKENRNHNDKTKIGKKSPKSMHEETSNSPSDCKNSIESKQDVSPRDIEFLATLELRSSEEDEKQKALRKEMKEKKRIQQLQQIQELQMQQDAMQQCDISKMKDEKKLKHEDRKKEAAREKRMSTERKSREDKNENKRRLPRKAGQSSDTSDSDEPKKHSIFDIVDDGPTYISMYDKVKARSCKNMQKQEEEKRQEKIKAKFSQLKQSRAKREEKKRSTSWDEDSESDQDRKKFSYNYSMVSSSEDERGDHSIRRETFQINDYDGLRKIDKLNYYNDSTTDEDPRNKLSRKNSRSRIMSDTSDDDSMKRNASIRNHIEIKKEIFSDNEGQGPDYFMKKEIKKESYNNSVKKEIDEKFSKQSLMNLFNDSLDDKKPLKKELIADSHMKATVDIVKLENDYKFNQLKLMCNDFSSEGELSSKFSNTEMRRKHKRKQKKQKTSVSEDDNKSTDYSEQSPLLSGEVKHRRNSEKAHKHSNKKDRRKEKLRDSVDSEDCREDKAKSKKGKKSLEVGFDSKVDGGASNIRRDEKMENIFGPISDDSDSGPRASNITLHNNFNINDLPSTMANDKFDYISKSVDDFMLKDKEKEESRRRKERKRKEKRFISRDDDNSLDVDAAGKAIEASLFADSVPENDNQNTKADLDENCIAKSEQDVFRFTDADDSLETTLMNNDLKQAEKVRKEAKEKKKKKKKSKEERQNRHHHHDKSDQSDRHMTDSNSHPVKELDLFGNPEVENKPKLAECKPDLLSPSLPRLTESPPPLLFEKSDSAPKPTLHSPNQILETVPKLVKECSPSLTSELKDCNNVPSVMLNVPKSSVQIKSPPPKPSDVHKPIEKLISGFGGAMDVDISENAVKSIAEFDKPKEPIVDNKITNKVEEKVEEKPRAVISQEETEDAVAALLGESFGGNSDSFVNCFDEVDDNSSTQAAGTSMESENIPEEDAEEMRQAVQNLNSELDVKPDTPLSENDLQIDTDTEEQDDSQQETPEKVPVPTVPVSASLPTTTVIEREVKVSEAVSNSVVSTSNKTLSVLNKALGFQRFNDIKVKPDQSLTNQTQTESTVTAPKRDIFHQVTSTATPVISNTWTLAGNKPHLISVHTNHLNNRDDKPHLTANILQIKAPVSQGITLSTQPRPVIGTQARMNHPFVLNQMIRPGHIANLQPPTIKIPSDHHPMYQKQSGVVISPRMANDPRLQSPKSSPHSDMSSPRLTILSPTPQCVGLPSPNSLQQRSPGHVTVVRMQQPPLSPIQTMHLPHGAPCRTMVSPNRPNSVLVQTQAPPMHINRLPVTPVLAPLSKPLHSGNILQQQKPMTLNPNSAILHAQKIVTEVRKADPRTVQDIAENSKYIITPSCLQQSTNPTVMAQNRLIMQNAGLHMANKMLFNNATHITDKRDLTNLPFKSEMPKIEPLNKPTYGPSPIIHISTVNQSTSPMVHAVAKPVISIGQEQFHANRPYVSNVIHPVNSQRLLTTVAMTSVIQGDHNKPQPSVLSMAPIRSPSVLTKFERNAHVSVTSSVLSNVVMTPVMMKSNTSITNKNMNSLQDIKKLETRTTPFYTPLEAAVKEQHVQILPPKVEEKIIPQTVTPTNAFTETPKAAAIITPLKIPTPPVDNSNKCVTDFEELLKDTTNEIKVLKDVDKKVEIPLDKGESQMPSSNNLDIKVNDTKVITEKTEPPTPAAVVEKLQQEIKVEPVIENKDDSEGWKAKEVNIKSVIKKVDEVCNNEETIDKPKEAATIESKNVSEVATSHNPPAEIDTSLPVEILSDPLAEIIEPQKPTTNKRGGRTARGRKSEKQSERVQTRQISKPARGSPASRRGRGGRAKVDKKTKKSSTGPTLSGDVYDFHEDSGDETHTSPQNKSEARPRLILTIKSPHTGVVANPGTSAVTASISVTTREQPVAEKPIITPTVTKEEKSEDFVSPALNTRKSRRLQEKDGTRNTVDEVIDDVIKNASMQAKGTTKDGSTRRSTRQVAKTGVLDKVGADVRKSPRGGKRTRDRSSSETSMDSSDEKTLKKDDIVPPGPKIPKLAELTLPVPEKMEAESSVTNQATNVTEVPTTPAPAPAPTPIMKPPKKMISEISAKLASTFDTVSVRPLIPVIPKESESAVKSIVEKPAEIPDNKPGVVHVEKPPDVKMCQPMSEDVRLTNVPELASGSALQPCEPGFQRRSDAVPPGRGAMSGVVDEADLRVQSPALPHRPPLTHRVTPILMRACDSEALEACRASPAQAGVVGGVGPIGAGGARAYRAPFVPSLPRGAHHPPPPPPAHPVLAARPHHPLKHVAIVGPQPQSAAQSRVTHTSVPSVSPQGSITGEGMYPHFSHQHYQVYQQHFRATQQDVRATPLPYTRSPREAEGSEAPTPPLELRRPPPSARVPRPAHSPSPADRLISGRGSPPPAHGGAGVSRLPSALPPLGPPGPPHASQVPREADSLQMLLRRYPVMWQGLLALKNDGAAVQMHFVHGNPGVAGNTLPRHVDGSTPPLRIAQRMRLEPVQLEAVHRKMQMENEHCMLLALPCGRDHMDVLQQSTNLTAGFITYLQKKQAAGIVNVAPPGHHQAMYTVHIFPSCEFANENLNRIAPDLLHRVADIAHLLIVIATV